MIIDNRLLSTQGQKEITQETKDLGKNLQVIASDVPGAEGGNLIENFIGDVVKARGDNKSNFAMHSQGNLLSNAGIRYMGYDAFTDLKIDKDAVTFGSFGSPESYAIFDETIKGMEATYNGTSTHDNDLVGEGLGNNTGVNGKRGVESYFDVVNPSTYIDAANLFNAFKPSPHSTYYCGETQIDGKNQFRCGG